MKKNVKKAQKRTVKKQVKKPQKPLIHKTKKPAPSMSKSTAPLTPLNDRVIVRPLSQEEMGSMTASGIIIPDSSKDKPEQGTVIAVGPGKWNEDGDGRMPVSVEVGQRVMFSKYGFDQIKIDGTEYYVIAESNILAVIHTK